MHAVVTGGSAGIGAALARRLSREGYDLTLVARRKDALDELAASLPTRTFVRPADLADPTCVDAVVSDAEAALGPVDLLVNNAGIQYVQPGAVLEITQIERTLAINLTTPWLLTHRVLPAMLARRSGAIVNVSSVSGVNPMPGMAHYAGTKAALAMTSEAMRVELAPHGVHVLTVYPGPIHTEMELAAREVYGTGFIVRSMPTGDADRLADLVARGLKRRTARVIYPRVYAPGWWFAGLFTAIGQRFAPALPLPGPATPPGA